MKKTILILAALLVSVALIFTACGKTTNKPSSTTNPVTTSRLAESSTAKPNTTTERNTADITGGNMTTNPNAGAPESTSKDSALGDAVEDAAEGAADANERIANGVRNAEDRMRR